MTTQQTEPETTSTKTLEAEEEKYESDEKVSLTKDPALKTPPAPKTIPEVITEKKQGADPQKITCRLEPPHFRFAPLLSSGLLTSSCSRRAWVF